ncbi:uncharacterized protein Z519_08223 [Cladophialophora bantiana CBS 173.52]|uniref:AB hydrolase-1 domain-containing protein n=1 Tax=Cladophialophora bantiana (strain ATCC 10958 / CBS 173.52 / CDC B-1940 / NIH 8579) TaxID=1442370 RepID=A0A0D2FXX8_CLAB1|nr:uncharacterized protein Z519_08223 [Cladophialophora bantiana CBS 173.52]KIW91327.1 hypothetical protein Z519_08223 [Cladophialophora bantiana CBS 173.52]
MTAAAAGISRHEFSKHDKTLSYLDAGPRDGPLLVFIHGWPAVAETWKLQLTTFSALGFRVVAPDMPGYGQSRPKSREKRDYALQGVVEQLVRFLRHLGRGEAVWVGGHDHWGAAVVWALVAHNPEVCLGVVTMGMPYRTLEMGVRELVKYANRDLYPEEEYPHAQWAHQVFYEEPDNYEKAVKLFDSDIERFIKLVYARPVNAELAKDKPAATAKVLKDGGWFGGAESLPEADGEDEEPGESLLDEDTQKNLVKALSQDGFWAPSAYFLNHDVNLQWCEDWSINEGVISVPVLFVETLNDPVAGTYNSTICEPMKNYCRKLTTVSISAGQWVALEAPRETNAAILRWIARELPEDRAWPGGKKNPLKKNE